MDEGAFLPRPPEGDHASGGGYRNQQPKRRKSPLHSILWRLTGKYFDNRPASHGKRGGIRQVLLSNRDPNVDPDILCRISALSPTGSSPPFSDLGNCIWIQWQSGGTVDRGTTNVVRAERAARPLQLSFSFSASPIGRSGKIAPSRITFSGWRGGWNVCKIFIYWRRGNLDAHVVFPIPA